MSAEHKPLPVHGYKQQDQASVDLVNGFKKDEERLLLKLDAMREHGEVIDQRWLAIGRTQLEQAFMAINRSVFKPDRVTLPFGDA